MAITLVDSIFEQRLERAISECPTSSSKRRMLQDMGQVIMDAAKRRNTTIAHILLEISGQAPISQPRKGKTQTASKPADPAAHAPAAEPANQA